MASTDLRQRQSLSEELLECGSVHELDSLARLGENSRAAAGGSRAASAPIPRLLQHPLVRTIELQLHLRSAPRQAAHVTSLAAALTLNLALDPRELQLQALHLEHRAVRLLAAGRHHQLCEQPRELRIVLERPLLTGRVLHRRAQVAFAQVL